MPLDMLKIKKEFPPIPDGAYLDSAATSLTPLAVMDAELEYYTDFRANVHRGFFKEAVRATDRYEEVRKQVAAFIHADPEEIIFTSGATESSNMFVRMIDESAVVAGERMELVSTVMEHHAGLVPLQQFAQRRGLPLRLIPMKGSALDYEQGAQMITKKTALLSVMLASNVSGAINDVHLLAGLAHHEGAIVVVDATAAAGHILIDVRKLGCDALYFSGHKMFAPTGVGVLFVKRQLLERLSPSVFGGHMISHVGEQVSEWAEIPSRFEAGTKNIAGVIGLGAAIDFLERHGVEEIREHVKELVGYAISELEKIPGVSVIAEKDPEKNIGIVSFVCAWSHPHDVAEILARDNVAVRPGHHCAMLLHAALKIPASTRASFHLYNSKHDVDMLVEGVRKAYAIFAQ